ncbi:hypothetical protein [Nostoc sp. DSM 114167]
MILFITTWYEMVIRLRDYGKRFSIYNHLEKTAIAIASKIGIALCAT